MNVFGFPKGNVMSDICLPNYLRTQSSRINFCRWGCLAKGLAIKTLFNNLLSLGVRNVKLLLEHLAVLMKKLMRSCCLLEGSKDT